MNIGNDVDSVTHAFEYADSFFSSINCADCEDAIFNTNIVLDELISNIIKYSGSDGIDIEFDINKNFIEITITDSGCPFNPTQAEGRDNPNNLDDCKVGGVGLKIVKSIVKKMEYKREGDFNILVVWVPLEEK